MRRGGRTCDLERNNTMLSFAVTIFLSAFLLFLVQPLIARVILPWFGGSAAVWTTCLMFFQVTLLMGYAYAHATIRFLRPKAQATLHLLLLCASLLALPILPGAGWKPVDGLHPEARIVALLAATIGIPYLLLSTTGPLLQAWFARRHPTESPYRLYALSNAGSLLALIGYPVLIEPVLRLKYQAYAWSAAFLAFVVLCGVLALRMRRLHAEPQAPDASPAGESRPEIWRYLLWVGLAFCPSTLLVAVTSHMTQNIAPIPLLWVAPLALYLLSFILTFESERWYGRRFWFPLFIVSAALMLAFLFPDDTNAPLKAVIPLFTIGFFVCAMMCHGELYRLRPAPSHLTAFYLMVSLGGALGGVFVGLVSPVLFRTYLELPVGLLITVLFITLVIHRDHPSLPGPFGRYIEYTLAGALAAGFVFLLAIEQPRWASGYRLLVRNFYGALRVQDDAETPETEPMRELHHGTINHGTEFLHPGLRRRPTTYYGRGSGVGIALSSMKPLRRIGLVGLGAGTLASYGRPGDFIRFYEINPVVVDIANSQFYYLKECMAKMDVQLGDARLTMERERPQGYDVLAVDAFSGDSIPVHLLTVEAFREYFRHLKPDGLLAVHISNRYLDLGRIVARIARELHKSAVYISNEEDNATGVFSSDWIVLSSIPDAFTAPEWNGTQREAMPDPSADLWTDDYSNLLRILK